MKNILYFILLFITSATAYSAEVVRMDIQIGANNYEVDIELFDTITENTVLNFLNYVDTNPRYDGSFIHRSAPGFVLQGGGFIYDPDLGAFEYDSLNQLYSGGLQEVAKDAPVANEFQGSGLSNLRGTIAMAKFPDNPDSATSEWFINLADNSANLDTQNGGFTVFGKVIDKGMDVFDLIEAVSISNLSAIHSAIDSIPLQNYTTGDSVTQSNLIRVNTARRIQRPIMETDVSALDFGLLAIGDSALLTVNVQNTGNADLVMDGSSIVAITAPYTIVSEGCSNITLTANGVDTCSITVRFSPVSIIESTAQVQIVPSVNPNNVTLSIDIIGEGVPVTPVLYLVDQPSLTLDFGGVAPALPETLNLVIQNRGDGILSLSSLVISGSNSSLFSIDTGCNNATTLTIAQTCTLAVDFSPVAEGNASAVLTIGSNAGSIDVTLSGEGLGPEIEVALSHDSGYTPLNVPKMTAIPVKNTGLAELKILSISISGSDAADFAQDNTCPDVATLNTQPLSPLYGQCTIVLTFTPTSSGNKTAVLTIVSTDSDEPTVNISLSGSVGNPDIEAVSELDMGVSSTSGIPTYNQFEVFNRGLAPLNFVSFSLAGINSSDFSVANDCPGISPDNTLLPLELNESCTIVVQMQATSIGEISAQLTLESNDPDKPAVVINLRGIGDTDVDGIAAVIEQAAPNSGDANNDNVQDDIQSNVVSFVTALDRYATIVTPPGTSIADLTLPVNPDTEGEPDGILFNHGLFQFKILVPFSTPGAVVKVAVLMPQGDSSTTFYKYGPTFDNSTPHWYEFLYDGITGAQYLGDVSVEPQGGGPKVTRSMFVINLIDGARGDNDLMVNGVISNVSAVGTVSVSDSGASSGALSGWFLLLFITLLTRHNRVSFC